MKRIVLSVVGSYVIVFAIVLLPSSLFACGKERLGVYVAQDVHVKYFYVKRKVKSGKLVKPLTTTI